MSIFFFVISTLSMIQLDLFYFLIMKYFMNKQNTKIVWVVIPKEVIAVLLFVY